MADVRLCVELDHKMIDDFIKDVHDAKEECYVLYRLKEGDGAAFKNRIRYERGTEYFAVVCENEIAAVARITKNPYPANGMLGYIVNPKCRGKGYAKLLVDAAIKFCKLNEINELTAVVLPINGVSMHILVKAGFVPTGLLYDWVPEPDHRKAIEMVYRMT